MTCLKFCSNCLLDIGMHVKCWPLSETQSIYTTFLDFNIFLHEKFLINKFLFRLRVTFVVGLGPYELYDIAITTRSTARPCQVQCSSEMSFKPNLSKLYLRLWPLTLAYSDQPLLKCLEMQAEIAYDLVIQFYTILTDRLGLYSFAKLLTLFTKYSILSSKQNFVWIEACSKVIIIYYF